MSLEKRLADLERRLKEKKAQTMAVWEQNADGTFSPLSGDSTIKLSRAELRHDNKADVLIFVVYDDALPGRSE